MNITLENFIRTYLGVAGVGDTTENLGQCVGLIEKWLDINNLPHIWGNAVDLLNNAPLSVYKIVRNQPTNMPSGGNIVCWDATWGGGNGHCAIVLAANVNQLAVLEQNNPNGSPPLVATHGYTGVAGWIILPAKG